MPTGIDYRGDLVIGGIMATLDTFVPQAIFSVEDTDQPNVPRVLIAPHRYIQGEGILDHLGRYLSIIPSERSAVLISEGGQERFGERILQSLKQAEIRPVEETFRGECSTEEVERVVAVLRSVTPQVDSLIAVGGGKCLDSGKCIAHRLSVPLVTCPTIASTDAPCSAVSVIYNQDGTFKGVEHFPNSPTIVAVDTGVIAAAPLRYLVAGMGDAMSTWYEARTCFQNPKARSVLGARITIAAAAIAELCAQTVFDYGLDAADAVRKGEVNEALDRVVEANTLLSGVGFESGGVAAAHAVATVGLTALPSVHKNFFHGEMVAIGILTQLIMEVDIDESRRVASFFAKVGLPVHLGHLGLDIKDGAKVLEEAMAAAVPLIHNEPFEVTAVTVFSALLQAHELGVQVASSNGDAAYREIHGMQV